MSLGPIGALWEYGIWLAERGIARLVGEKPPKWLVLKYAHGVAENQVSWQLNHTIIFYRPEAKSYQSIGNQRDI